MCVSPREIKNPTRFFEPTRDKTSLCVPCNKCFECEQTKRNEWLIRAYSEWTNAKAHNGFAMMLLLTYREKCAPRFNVVTSFRIKSSRYCFSAHDIHRFIDSLKKYFKRQGLTPPAYLITSEYGENRTKRPHYHMIIYNYDKSVTPKMLYDLVQHYWHYGLVSPLKKNTKRSSVDDLVITNYNGIAYCCKYITKESDFYDQCSGVLKSTEHWETEFKDFLPQRYNSYKFGECMLSSLLSDSKIFDIITNGVRMDFDLRTYAIPRYIINKLKYVYRQDGYTESGNKRLVADYSDLWIEYKRQQAVSLALKEAQRLRHLTSYIAFSKCNSKHFDWTRHYEWIKSLNIDYFQLAVYKLFLKDRKMPDVALECRINPFVKYRFKPSLDSLDIQAFIDWHVDACCIVKDQNYRKVKNGEFEPYKYNYLQAFKHFDQVLELIDSLRLLSRHNKAAVMQRDFIYQKRLKKLMKDEL